MAECGGANLSLSYTAKTDCKYTYASTWCPVCERDSPRRRTRSETTTEICRRRQRDMKSFTSHIHRKYEDTSHEYENMMDLELEYECRQHQTLVHSHHHNNSNSAAAELGLSPPKFECCVHSSRVRANLCELPTSYIANNSIVMTGGSCQVLAAGGGGGGGVTSTKLTDKLSEYYAECCRSVVAAGHGGVVTSCAGAITTTSHQSQEFSHHHHGITSAREMSGATEPVVVAMKSCRGKSPIASKNFHSTSKPLLTLPPSPKYTPTDNPDTTNTICSTYFDPATTRPPLTDTNTNHRDRYTQEMELLRSKLRDLKSCKYNEYMRLHPPMTVRNLDQHPVNTTTGCNGDSVATSDNSAAAEVRIIEDRRAQKLLHQHKLEALQQRVIQEQLERREREKVLNSEREREKESEKVITTMGRRRRGGGAEGKVVSPVRSAGGGRRELRSAGKLSVKTRSKLSAVKMRKRKGKEKVSSVMAVKSVSSSDFTESECSDSEAEYSNPEDVSTIEESEPSSLSDVTTPRTSNDILGAVTSVRLDDAAGDQADLWPIRNSQFAYIPPYISFNSHDSEKPFKLPIGKKYLKWKLSTITPIIVRKTLTNTGFILVRSEFSRESNEWLGTWGKHMKSPMFKTLKSTQKLNHFTGTFQIGRKDRLWRNMQRLALKHGHREFGFLPQTFVLPQDLKLLKHSWMYKNGSGGEKWIIKPPASARGVGIKVINKWSQLPKRSSLIVQRYISNPYLINGSKFDLRLYVLVTSFNPLRIYLYPEGLARFASAKYSGDDRDLKDRFMHLTNYSINKLSSQYAANEDAHACKGHKWTLSKLWDYLELKGVNTRVIWTTLHELVIKTILSGESPIVQLCSENLQTRYNCYELFGVDVLLDSDLRPWLLEVNISPSLHSASPLDAYVKGPLVQALFNLAQFHLPPRLKKVGTVPPCLDGRLYTVGLTRGERLKHNRISQMETRSEYLSEILDNLTGDDVRVLTQAEDELTVKGPFERIFPTAKSCKYLEFIEARYYNRLFDAWENMFEKNRKPGIKMLQSLCVQKVHLKVASQSKATKKSLSMMNTQLVNLQPSTENQNTNNGTPDTDTPTDEETAEKPTLISITTTTLPGVTV